MELSCTNVFNRNWQAFRNKAKRYALNEGGTSSSKTWSILQILITILLYGKGPLIVSIISESMPHLKRGCLRDFRNIMASDYDPERFSKTDSIYDFGDGKLAEFFPADDDSKLRGGRRDIAFFNELNNNKKDAFDQIDMRTSRFLFCDWNPTHEFFGHEQAKLPDAEFIHSTYKDAMPYVPEAIIRKIESYKQLDPNNWRIYGEGLLGFATNLVHPLFNQVKTLPEGGVVSFGLDFGYANDPTALVKNVTIGNELYSKLLVYETGLKITDMIARFTDVGLEKSYDEVFADSEDPRLIDELCDAGFNVKAAPKGPDSVRAGIDYLNTFKQFWTEDSLDGIKEQRNYRYVTDQNGKATNKTIDAFNHALDARR